jgi:23S rRNA (guanine2445-N2)-methyltransferase / 23S rRNA (guanine2069-N7)-methyltransferase
MRGTLDVQRDHVAIIRGCVALLRPQGQLWFSTNLRKFKLDLEGLEGLVVEELSGSIPPDFSRNKTIHRCWVISRS